MSFLALLVSSAASPAVELDMSVGLGGHARLGAWTPVRVVVANRGQAVRGELVIPPQDATDEFSDYRLAVTIPPSSRQAFMLYARPQTDSAALNVEFRPEKGAPIVQRASCAWHDARIPFITVISRQPGGLGSVGATVPPAVGISGERPPEAAPAIAYVTPDRETGALGLPDRPAGYEGVTAVVLRDISPEDFEEAERDALVAWVESGGLLVIISAANVAEFRDSFIEKLSPVSIRGQKILPHLGALADAFRQNINYGRAMVADTVPKRGARVIVQQDGLPLLACRPWETGMVYFLAADCTAPPLNSANALLGQMWACILQDRPPAEAWSPLSRLRPAEPPARIGGLSGAIVQLPVVRWETFTIVAGYLLAYIAVLAVVNVLARQMDRREWTGVATLLVVLGFGGGAFYLGSSAMVSACRTYEAGVVAMRSGASVGSLEAVSGVRSPTARRYQVTPASSEQTIEYLAGAARARSWPLIESGTFALRNMPVDLWGFAAFRVRGPWRMGGRITLRLVPIDSRRSAVSVCNETSYELRWPFVLLPGAPLTMKGPIPAGTTRETDPFDRARLQAWPTPLGQSAFAILVEHCQAQDSRKSASLDARIRHRLLRQLGETQDYQAAATAPWAPGTSAPPEPSPLISSSPLFGAWIRAPAPLVNISPPGQLHTSEILLLVQVPQVSD